MPERYTVRFAGPLTSITESHTGPWPRWEMARAAAVEELEDHVRECFKTLDCLRRAGNFFEYEVLVEELAAAEEGEVAQVEGGDTLN